jgi:hypothetical protein
LQHGRFQWQDTVPEDVGKPAEDGETLKFAIVARHVKVYNDPRRVLKLHSVLVQSPLLKKLLMKTLKDYPGVTVSLQRLEFMGRFEPLIHRWEQLQEAVANLDESVEEEKNTKAHAEVLLELMRTEFKEVIEAATDMKKNGVITYEYLWTIFQPGQLLFARQDNQETALRLHETSYGKDRHGNKVFWVSCKHVEWDGTRFGYNKLNRSIMQYNGTKPIHNLSTFPLNFHKDYTELEKRLLTRGNKAEEMAGCHYKSYHGFGWRWNNYGEKDKYDVRGRIVIDTYGWNRFNPNHAIFVTGFHQKDPHSFLPPTAFDPDNIPPPKLDVDIYSDDDNEFGMPMDGRFADEDDSTRRPSLTQEQKMICSPIIRGYALKEKIWLNFFVNSVQDIEWSTGAFEKLVLPKNQKELILGFTESQRKFKGLFDDIVEGKGRGIILLLCGPPG